MVRIFLFQFQTYKLMKLFILAIISKAFYLHIKRGNQRFISFQQILGKVNCLKKNYCK